MSGGRESYTSKYKWDVLWNFLPSLNKWSLTDSRQTFRMRSQLESTAPSESHVWHFHCTWVQSIWKCEMKHIPYWQIYSNTKILALSEICQWWLFSNLSLANKLNRICTIPKSLIYPDTWQRRCADQIKGIVLKIKQYQDHSSKIIPDKMYSKWLHLRLIEWLRGGLFFNVGEN